MRNSPLPTEAREWDMTNSPLLDRGTWWGWVVDFWGKGVFLGVEFDSIIKNMTIPLRVCLFGTFRVFLSLAHTYLHMG